MPTSFCTSLSLTSKAALSFLAVIGLIENPDFALVGRAGGRRDDGVLDDAGPAARSAPRW
jgi:hypothetical protein